MHVYDSDGAGQGQSDRAPERQSDRASRFIPGCSRCSERGAPIKRMWGLFAAAAAPLKRARQAASRRWTRAMAAGFIEEYNSITIIDETTLPGGVACRSGPDPGRDDNDDPPTRSRAIC